MQHSDQQNSRAVILSIFALFGVPATLLDLGSGDGTMVGVARALGSRAIGLDLSARPPDVRHDLTRRWQGQRPFDMILCLETAEHLPPAAAETLAWTINANRHANSRLIFSAALPGQGGEGHVNEQPPRYWRELFYRFGKWSYRQDLTTSLQLVLMQTAGPLAQWLVPNIQVF